MTHVLRREQLVHAPLEEVFDFFAQARNLEAITPPWLSFQVLAPEPTEVRSGTVIRYRLRLHRVPLSWISRIEEWEPGRRFVDRQLKGPYRLWHHTHDFERHPEGTLVRDSVRYELPVGFLGEVAHVLFVRRDLARIFDYRIVRIRELLDRASGAPGS